MGDYDPAAVSLHELLYPLILSVLFALIPALLQLILDYKTGWKGFRQAYVLYFACGFPVALAGYSAGFLTGISRAPAVGSLLPAILSLVGGVAVYVFGSENKNRILVGFCVCVLIAHVFLGLQFGALERETGRVGRLMKLSEQEKVIRNYRKLRELPGDLPTWLLIEEGK
ncbi:MAG: hypothetical protein KGM42_18360 [Hyphomicrobiales bacterium]|nr:hypothetical protein [Hyphomicrobiales bacterium]